MSGLREAEAREQLAAGAVELGLRMEAGQLDRLMIYLSLLQKWNRIYNLTAIRERSKLVSHHLLDSLAVVPHLPDGSVVDVGTGPGLPGIPMAIAQPSRRITLLDSNHKKGAFLQQAKIECGLDNCSVHVGRAEDWKPREACDGAISRAFSDLAGFVEAARGLVRPAGWLAAMKGVHPDEELIQLPADARPGRIISLEVPRLRATRHLVLIGLIPSA